MVDVVCFGEGVVALWEESTDCGEETGALVLGEFSAEGVDGDVDGSSVSLKGENASHNVCRRPVNRLAEGVEVLQVSFVERVTDDFDVEVIEVGGGDAVTEVLRYSEMP